MTNHNFSSNRSAALIRAGLYMLGLLALVLGNALIAPQQGGVPVWQAVLGLTFCGLVLKAICFDTIKKG